MSRKVPGIAGTTAASPNAAPLETESLVAGWADPGLPATVFCWNRVARWAAGAAATTT
ncbi:hypothetical protein V3C33_13435 [Micrococcaceae bacterium Sec5.7]